MDENFNKLNSVKIKETEQSRTKCLERQDTNIIDLDVTKLNGRGQSSGTRTLELEYKNILQQFSKSENLNKASSETKPIEVNNSYIEKYPLLSGYVKTKTFEMKTQNSVIRVTPKQLNFNFNTETMKVEKETKQLKILNISQSPTKILVMPRQTADFKFNYIPTNWIVPGVALVISVTFKPTEPRPYYDWLRVCCESDSNLMIPIKATTSEISSLKIPEKINFGFVPIGERAVHKITLQPVKNKVMKFMFVIVKETLGCEIFPLQGKIGETPVEIKVCYCPSSYITVSIPVQLFITPLVSKPYYFTIEAHTKPQTTNSELPIPDVELKLKKYLDKSCRKKSCDSSKKILPKCEQRYASSTPTTSTQYEGNSLQMSTASLNEQ